MTALAKIPPRTSICLDCRTALVDGERCDGGKRHRVASLATAAGEQKLVDEVWGPANLKRQLRRAAKNGGGGATIGSILDCGGADCSGCDATSGGGDVLGAILVVVVGAIVAVLVGWLVLLLVRFVRDRLDRPKPFGALDRAPALHGRGVVGTVVAAERSDSPVSEATSVAYAIELRSRRALSGGAVMLRDAATRGFDVLLGDGRKARVPAGRVRLDGTFARVPVARDAVESLVASIDPSRDEDRSNVAPTSDPLPFDDVVEVVLRPGDTVEMFGELTPSADPDAAGAAYREAASLLVPVGVPRLRVVSTS